MKNNLMKLLESDMLKSEKREFDRLTKLDKKNSSGRTYYGPSTGDTGDYGVGDIVRGTKISKGKNVGDWKINGEPTYNVFIIENNKIRFLKW